MFAERNFIRFSSVFVSESAAMMHIAHIKHKSESCLIKLLLQRAKLFLSLCRARMRYSIDAESVSIDFRMRHFRCTSCRCLASHRTYFDEGNAMPHRHATRFTIFFTPKTEHVVVPMDCGRNERIGVCV